MKSYLNVHFNFLCSLSFFFLLILLFHHDKWQAVLNSVNFILLQSRRINIPDNKEHLKCPQGPKPGKKIQLEGQKDWQWSWQQQEQQQNGEGNDSGSTLCPWTNTLDLQGSSGHSCHKQQHSRLQKDNLTAYEKMREPAHIACLCSHSVNNRLNPNQLKHKQSH